MIYKEKKTPAVLHSSARGQLLQKAILVHSVQASVISRAGMWHWSLHLLILHLRELNAKVLREEVAPYELRVCASFLTCVCKSLFFSLQAPEILLSDTDDFFLPRATLTWPVFYREDLSGWSWECKHLYSTLHQHWLLSLQQLVWMNPRQTNKDFYTSFRGHQNPDAHSMAEAEWASQQSPKPLMSLLKSELTVEV